MLPLISISLRRIVQLLPLKPPYAILINFTNRCLEILHGLFTLSGTIHPGKQRGLGYTPGLVQRSISRTLTHHFSNRKMTCPPWSWSCQ